MFRQYVMNRYTDYGNDSDEVDAIYGQLISDFAAMCNAGNGKSCFIFPGGVSTFGRQLEWIARFVTLNDDWQKMVIEQYEK